jgi:hypothetical protein
MRKGLGRAREIGVISGVPSIAAATISVPTRVSGCHRVAYINPIVSYSLKTGPCHPEFPLSNGPYPQGHLAVQSAAPAAPPTALDPIS